MKNPQYLTVAILAIAVTLLVTSCGSPYPPGHRWWTGEPIRGADGRITYVPQQTDGDENAGEEPAGCRASAAADPFGRGYRPLGPTGERL